MNIFKLKRFGRQKYIVAIQLDILICMYLINTGLILIVEYLFNIEVSEALHLK